MPWSALGLLSISWSECAKREHSVYVLAHELCIHVVQVVLLDVSVLFILCDTCDVIGLVWALDVHAREGVAPVCLCVDVRLRVCQDILCVDNVRVHCKAQ